MRYKREIKIPVPVLFCPLCVEDHEADRVMVDTQTGQITHVEVVCGKFTIVGPPSRIEERDSFARGMYTHQECEEVYEEESGDARLQKLPVSQGG